jgi:hypothetical protein
VQAQASLVGAGRLRTGSSPGIDPVIRALAVALDGNVTPETDPFYLALDAGIDRGVLRIGMAKATLSGSGQMTSTTIVQQTGAVSLRGGGTMVVSAGHLVSAAAALSGQGILTGQIAFVRPAQAALTGAGALNAAASPLFALSALLQGSGKATAGRPPRMGPQTLALAVALDGLVTFQTDPFYLALDASRRAMAPDVAILLQSVVHLRGFGDLVASPRKAKPATVTMSGSGGLSVRARETRTATVSLIALGSLIAMARALKPRPTIEFPHDPLPFAVGRSAVRGQFGVRQPV